ncbi:MAG: HAD-IIIA family hydrolase [Muribaculaceae bacterium]|nr:HAD-IIIA family hydrolase [Muribaculaceae bacterium]
MKHNEIRLLVMDVDGTLTDGKINMGPEGEVFKSFNIRDGYAINEMLPAHGIVPAIITGRTSQIVANRAKELHITELYQGKHDKLETLLQLMDKYGCTRDNVAYIGDDILDIVCMRQCGLVGCPADACSQVKELAHFVSSYKGGDGAVREFIEYIIGR